MKLNTPFTRFTALVLLLSVFHSCIVISFYPVYEQEDLFANDLLLGNWLNEDSVAWNFEFENPSDSLGYIMHIISSDGRMEKSDLQVHVIRLDSDYYLDFYIDDYEPGDNRSDFKLYDLHVMPVHSFARLQYWEDSIKIEWFDPDWMNEQIQNKTISVSHLQNDDRTLLTAKPKELKALIQEIGNNEDAFSLDAMLYKHIL